MGKKTGSRRLNALNLQLPEMNRKLSPRASFAVNVEEAVNETEITSTSTAPTGSTRRPAIPPSEAQLSALQMREPIGINCTRPSSEVATPPSEVVLAGIEKLLEPMESDHVE